LDLSRLADLVELFREQTHAPEYYKSLIFVVASKLAATNAEKVVRCDDEVATLHAKQIRGDGASYIVHPRRVALLASAAVREPDVPDALLVGLLHDVVEDCGVEVSQISSDFGPRVAHAVEAMTASAGEGETREERRARKQSKWERLAGLDDFVVTMHLMDVLDNCLSLRMISPGMDAWKKLPRWIWQTKEYQVPLAEERYPQVARWLEEELAFQRGRGVDFGTWQDE
jgi:guanosine-3',5'-bis(diphosphate) 3'-pyrophosphohydrolase